MDILRVYFMLENLELEVKIKQLVEIEADVSIQSINK